jgi:hypothetical protein
MESDWLVKYEKLHSGFKEHKSIDVKHGFVFSTTITHSSINDTSHLPTWFWLFCHIEKPFKATYVQYTYHNRSFLNLNDREDGIIRKEPTKIPEIEIKRNK